MFYQSYLRDNFVTHCMFPRPESFSHHTLAGPLNPCGKSKREASVTQIYILFNTRTIRTFSGFPYTDERTSPLFLNQYSDTGGYRLIESDCLIHSYHKLNGFRSSPDPIHSPTRYENINSHSC